MKRVGLDPSLTMEEAIQEGQKWARTLSDKDSRELFTYILENLNYPEGAKVSEELTKYFSYMREEDFVFDHDFKVTAQAHDFYGKWPSLLGDAVYLDSTHFMPELLEMLRDNLMDAMVRNKVPLERILSTDGFFEAFQEPVEKFPINDFAMTSNLLFKDSYKLYKHDISVALSQTSSLSLQTGAY